MKKWLLGVLAVSLILAGCSGGGGSSAPVSSAGVTQGVAVDPYVVGAVFAEVDAAGNVLQMSAPSDAQGVFVFSSPLEQGSIVKLVGAGLHMGGLFQTELKRKVDQSSGELVVSPLTTLVVNAGDEQTARNLLVQAGLTPPADFNGNPMAAVAGKTPAEMTDAELAAVVANIAVRAALEVVGGDVAANDQKFNAMVAAVAQTVENSFVSVAAIQARTQGGASVSTDSLLAGAVSVADFAVEEETSGDGFDSADQAALEAAADNLLTSVANGQVAEVQIDAGGNVAATPCKPLGESLAAGHAALKAYMAFGTGGKTDDLLAAVKNFQAAAVQAGIDASATQAQKDEANFFGGLAQALATLRPYSDFVDDGLNDLGDILDAFGFSKGTANRGMVDLISYPQTCVPVVYYTDPTTGYEYSYQDCTSDPIPQSAPTTGELQQFLFEHVQNDLSQAIAAFEQVSPQFGLSMTDDTDGSVTEFDSSDAMFFKALALTLMGQINFQQAYNLNVDLYQQEQLQQQANLTAGGYTAEGILADNPAVGTLKQNAQAFLDAAKGYFSQAADGFLAAIAAVEAESDSGAGQQNDLINLLAETCSWDPATYVYACAYDAAKTTQEIEQAREGIQSFKTSLFGMTAFNVSNPANSFELNLAPLFAGLDMRSLIPNFSGDNAGMFPDPTLGGMLGTGTPDLNEDLDGDQMPDLLMGYTQFGQAMFPDAPLWGYFYAGGAPALSGDITLNPDGTFTIADWQATIDGTWSIVAGKLELQVTGGSSYTATLMDGNGGAGYLNLWAQVAGPATTGSLTLYY